MRALRGALIWVNLACCILAGAVLILNVEVSHLDRQVRVLTAEQAQPAVALTAHAAPATTPPPCHGAYVQCVAMSPSDSGKGLVVQDGTGPSPGTPFEVDDHNGAPMAWVNIFGLYSGGAPGLPGGLICTTQVLKVAACLTPDTGTLELFDADGKAPVVLSRADILWLHRHDRSAP